MTTIRTIGAALYGGRAVVTFKIVISHIRMIAQPRWRALRRLDLGGNDEMATSTRCTRIAPTMNAERVIVIRVVTSRAIVGIGIEADAAIWTGVRSEVEIRMLARSVLTTGRLEATACQKVVTPRNGVYVDRSLRRSIEIQRMGIARLAVILSAVSISHVACREWIIALVATHKEFIANLSCGACSGSR